MIQAEFDPSDDRYLRGIIRRKVRQLIGRAGFTRQDREDLEQEIFARVLQGLRKFDPAKAHRNKFVTAIVERYVANVLRNKRAEKRDHRRITSLNVTITLAGDAKVELSQTISVRERDAQRRRESRDDCALSDLRADIGAFIAALPDDLRELAEGLMANSISEIARETGIPRTTLHDKLRRLRQRFESTDLRDYL